MTQSETDEVCRIINESGAQIVWVCLGCPKQEKWMYENRDRLKARALLGVGQAFDILAGTKMRAPRIIRSARLEWAYRLAKEPGRLWRRYLTTNSIFVYLMMKEMIASIFSRRGDRAQ
jgi:N-acetylglucosaminyldiphosphoundecaprenol N-acetyl-beta-D-mannosaminyltransferase